jgi:hypothetical protein
MRIVGCAIIYPLTLELFAFAIRRFRACNSDQFYRKVYWTIRGQKTSCKNFDDDYNATPLLKANDCQRKVDIVGNLFLIVLVG